jgi:hypothetical protein
MEITIVTPWTMASPLCRTKFPLMYQYTIKCVLRTAVITRFISRYSSVKCSSSKPYFRMSLYVTHCEHRMKLISSYFLRISPQYFISIKLNTYINVYTLYKRGGNVAQFNESFFWIFAENITLPKFYTSKLHNGPTYIMGWKGSSNILSVYIQISYRFFHLYTINLGNHVLHNVKG